jgi:hypothetical protein
MSRRTIPASTLALALLTAACRPASAPEAFASDSWESGAADAGIARAHLTQAAQDLAGSVPLVEGRDALLRVFLGARIAGLSAPPVQARLVATETGTTVRTYGATSPLAVIPTGTFAGTRLGTWNAVVAGGDLRPGHHLVVEIGAIPGVPEDRVVARLRVPAEGSLDVRTVAPLQVTLVPVIQSGLVPDVTGTRSAESWVSLAAAVFPLPGIEVEVAPAYTTAIALDGTSQAWSDLLDELEARRTAQGSTRHWIGAVRSTAPGIAGRGRVGGKSLVASDDAGHYQRIVAHELGHNLGLRHAPCGTDGGVDPAWPLEPAYDGAHTGVAGWDPRSDTVLDPGATYDLMSYCGGAANTWVSDFTYLKALDALLGVAPSATGIASPAGAAAADAGARIAAPDPLRGAESP